MVLRIFKSNHPIVIFLIPLLGFILWSLSIFGVTSVSELALVNNHSYLYSELIDLLPNSRLFSTLFSLLLIILQSYILIRLNFKFIFIESKTYLPSVLFLLYASIFPFYHQLHPLLIANLFLLFAIDRAFTFDKLRNQLKRYYESGLLIGIGVLFYPNLLYFVVLLWLTLIILRTFNWREWISSIFGIFTPIAFYFSILFLTNNHYEIMSDIGLVFFTKQVNFGFSLYSKIALGILVFLFLINFFGSARIVGLKKISTRKYFSLFTLFLFLCIVLFYIHPSISYNIVIVAAIPISIIQSIVFTETRKSWVQELIFVCIFACIVTIIWFH